MAVLSELWHLFRWVTDLAESEVVVDDVAERNMLSALREFVDVPDELNAALESGELKMREFMEKFDRVDDPHGFETDLTKWPWLLAALQITYAFTNYNAVHDDRKWDLIQQLGEKCIVGDRNYLNDWEDRVVVNPDALLKRLAACYVS